MKKIWFGIMCFILLGYINVFASGEITVSKNSITLKKGESTSFTVNAEKCAGTVEVKSSDSSIATAEFVLSEDADSQDKGIYFFDTSLGNKAATVNVKAIKTGTVTISVVLKDVATFEEEVLTGTKKIQVTVEDKQTVPVDDPKPVQTTKPAATEKPQGQVVKVDKTDLNTRNIVLVSGLAIMSVGIGMFIYAGKKKKENL